MRVSTSTDSILEIVAFLVIFETIYAWLPGSEKLPKEPTPDAIEKKAPAVCDVRKDIQNRRKELRALS